MSVLIIGAIIGVRLLHADTTIGNTPPPVVRNISYDTTKVSTFEGATFKINLPSDWKVMKTTDEPTPTYTWHGTSKEDVARWIDVYVDVNLPNFAVNRVVSTQANGTGISVTSDVSDNCVNFTGNASSGQAASSIPAKWQGIMFYCETGNYTRDVVGIVSPDGLNAVAVTGPTKGTHRYMIVFTDNSSSADYKIFTDALKSFVAK